MERELTFGESLGMLLIGLSALIGLGFGIFSIAKGVANAGITTLENKAAIESSVEAENVYSTSVNEDYSIEENIVTTDGNNYSKDIKEEKDIPIWLILLVSVFVAYCIGKEGTLNKIHCILKEKAEADKVNIDSVDAKIALANKK